MDNIMDTRSPPCPQRRAFGPAGQSGAKSLNTPGFHGDVTGESARVPAVTPAGTMTAPLVAPARGAEENRGIPKEIPKFVLEDLLHTVMDRYESLCRYLGWTPREKWIRELYEDLRAGRIGYDEILSILGDTDAFDLYPEGYTAHRYLFALAALLDLLDRCPASGDIPDWLCDERLAAAAGWFFIGRVAEPLREAINEVLSEVLPPEE